MDLRPRGIVLAPSRCGVSWIPTHGLFANRLYSQAHTYPPPHDIPIMSTSVRSDAAEGRTFGKSDATLAPKNWASNRT